MVEAPDTTRPARRLLQAARSYGFDINAVMLPETAVFRGQEGGHDHLRQGARRQQHHPAALGVCSQAEKAVPGVQDQGARFRGQGLEFEAGGPFEMDWPGR